MSITINQSGSVTTWRYVAAAVGLVGTTGTLTDQIARFALTGSGLSSASLRYDLATDKASLIASNQFGNGFVLTQSGLNTTTDGGATTVPITTLSGYGITDAVPRGLITTSGLTVQSGRLLGRSTAGTGAVEEITLGSGLTLSGGQLSSSGGGGPTLPFTVQFGDASTLTFSPTGVSYVPFGGSAVALQPTSVNVCINGVATTKYAFVEAGPASAPGSVSATVDTLQVNGLTASRLVMTSGAKVLQSVTLGAGLLLTGSTLSVGSVAWSSVTGTPTSLSGYGVQMSTARLLGRGTAGTGSVEELTIGSGLQLVGTTLSAVGGGSVAWSSITGTPTSLTGYGVQMSTARLLGRSTAGTGSVEELTIGSGLQLVSGVLSTTGGGGTPGGSNTQVQYNSFGTFGGTADFTFDDSSRQLLVTNSNSSAFPLIRVQGTSITGTGQLTARGQTTDITMFAQGSGVAGTFFGLPRAGLACLTTSSNATALLISNFSSSSPLVFGLNSSEVARFTSGSLTSGAMTISYSTDTTTSTTGALIVSGGIGIAKNLTVGGVTASTLMMVNANKTLTSVTLGTNLSLSGTTLNAAGGGGGTPGGANTQIQFNNSGAFGGSAGLTWTDSGTDRQLLVTNSTASALSALLSASGTGTGSTGRVRAQSVGTLVDLASNGSATAGTTFGIANASSASLLASGVSNFILGVGTNVPIIFGISTSEVVRMTSGTLTTGAMTISYSTDTTTSTTGALIVAGGIGVAKNLTVGGVTATTLMMVNANKTLTSVTLGTNLSLSGTTLNATGSVSSVALSLPGQFTVAGSPITSSGTLAVTWVNLSPNQILASPNGSFGVPSFRSLVPDDIQMGLSGFSTLLGRSGIGSSQNITIGNGLNLTGTTLTSTGATHLTAVRAVSTGAAQSVTGGTTPIAYSSIALNLGSAWSGTQFTAPVAGTNLYLVTASCAFSGVATSAQLQVFAASSLYAQGNSVATASGVLIYTVQTVARLSAGVTLDIRFSATATTDVSSQSTNNVLSITYLGAG